LYLSYKAKKMLFNAIYKQSYCIYLKPIALLILYFVLHHTKAQHQNNWIAINDVQVNPLKPLDTANFAFHFDFNTEPPQIKLINHLQMKDKFTINNETFSNNKGQLVFYSNSNFGFLNVKNQSITAKPFYYSEGTNISLFFPTVSDSLFLVLYKSDSLFNTQSPNPYGIGNIMLKSGLFNQNAAAFSQLNKNVYFENSNDYSPFPYQTTDYNTGFSYRIFNNYIDKKTGNYYLFFNIADSIFTSRYNPMDMSFSKPYYSGMVIEKNPLKNGVVIHLSSGENFKITENGEYAVMLHNGVRSNFPQIIGYYSNALLVYKFDKLNGKFSNELLIDAYPSVTLGRSRFCIASCDTIVYLYNRLTNNITKYVFDNYYKLLQKSTHSLPSGIFGLYDMTLAPNGKILISANLKNNLHDTLILVIDNPNSVKANIVFGKKIPLYKNRNEIGSEYTRIFYFPNTYGSYKRVDFTYIDNCKKNSVLFTNNSDTFWFKRFTYYMGNGDSVNTTINQKEVVYHYAKPGKYWVKLKAYYKEDAYSWFSDSVVVQTAPNAYFSNQTIKGCQYIAFQFKDSSTVFQIKKDSAVRHAWHFGDGNSNYWQTFGLNIRKNQNHTYFQNGKYTVTHTVSDGYCTDSFSRINEVNILPAPKPGIVAAPLTGCVPLNVALTAKYPDMVDSSYWQSTAGHTQSTKNQIGTSFTITQAGSFKIFHTQYGPTGCITSDTIEINAIMGINTQSSPLLFAATVLNNENALLYWQNVPFANGYQIFKNNLPIANTQDSFFIDQTNTNAQSYLYQIKATDVCLQKTQLSNEGKTILLTAKKASVVLAVLQWSPYLNWANGVKDYTILEVKNQNDLFIHQTKDSSYKDANFLENGAIQKCYKILATQNGNTSIFSESNTVCLNYESIVWLPTAITINGDGINEVFKISTFGIKSYTISIFNRWGEKVFESNNPDEEWRPKAQEQGVYMYVFKAKTNNGDYITKGTITILR